MASMAVQTIIFLATICSLTSESISTDVAPPPYGVPPQDVSPSSGAKYAYAYDVRDPQSGVYTSKKETRDGDLVYGNYVVEDADGSRRTVYYSADPIRGFNAEIRRQNGHPTQVAQVQESIEPIPLSIPLAVPVLHAYVAPPPPAQMHQVQFGTPVTFSLAPAYFARTTSEHEAPQYHTSLTSPTHSYSY